MVKEKIKKHGLLFQYLRGIRDLFCCNCESSVVQIRAMVDDREELTNQYDARFS